MLYLTTLTKRRDGEGYPFTMPVVRALRTLRFTQPITILCGDNGSGKSTLMSILAYKLNAVRIGQGIIERESPVAGAHDAFTVGRSAVAKHSFFFSAEDFIAYIGWVSRAKAEAREELRRIDAGEVAGDRAYLRMPHVSTLMDLGGLYAGDLAKESHGEGFLDFFRSRIVPGGLYLLDEPEGALSYANQYALGYLMREAVTENCQFLLATHSPILAALPGADLRELRDGQLVPTRYEDLESVRFLRMFLERGEGMFTL